jgi:hypothetical protein
LSRFSTCHFYGVHSSFSVSLDDEHGFVADSILSAAFACFVEKSRLQERACREHAHENLVFGRA